MNSKIKIAIFTIILIIVAAVIVGIGLIQNEQTEVEKERTYTVKTGNIKAYVSGKGMATPIKRIMINTTTAGRIKENYLQNGKYVSKGDLLVSFDKYDFSSERENIEMNLKKLHLELESLEELKVVANQASEYIGENHTELDTQIKKVKVEINSVEKELRKLGEKEKAPKSIYAPISGYIAVGTELQVGNDVAANQTLASITNYKELKANLSVDELDIPQIEIGQDVQIMVQAFPDEVFVGKVISIANEGDYNNGVATFKVEVSIENPKLIKSGMSVNAKIKLKESSNKLIVPIEALVEKAGKSFLNVMTDKGTKLIEVQTGINDTKNIVIRNGVSEGQKILLPKKESRSTNQLSK
ncbi:MULTISPECIES: efflux RND transporter periplasmic adaptor subunit [Bacillus]|uniref:efflux RND transporter periplasmic adaptor subunit n=1 Tax=Bacillus TaxID=1386 RepID=UPI00031D7A37|nr:MULTISPECIES: efflux RND transporter periplasmic adaptor subunit [Bacillus]